MATYIFKTPGKYQKNSSPLRAIKWSNRDEVAVEGNVVTYKLGFYGGSIDPATDTVTIDGTVFSGTAEELQDAIIAVFPSAGGSASTTPVLQSQGNGSKWLLGVNDLGATVTTRTDEGSPTVIYRWSPNGTKWFYGANDEGGVLTVEESKNYADDTAAAAGGIPIGGLYHTDGFVKIRTV